MRTELRSNASQFFGSPGSLTTELDGDRIEAFAELIERTYGGKISPKPTDT